MVVDCTFILTATGLCRELVFVTLQPEKSIKNKAGISMADK